MRIGIISDTHGMIKSALNIIPSMGEVGFIIHLGDYIEDSREIEKRSGLKVVAVKGNCDKDPKEKDEIVLELDSHKLLLVHGHQYGVKSDLNRLYYRALELGCDIALYGHTHIPMVTRHEGILIINPGSVALPRGGAKASFGILKLDGDDSNGRIVYV